MRAFDAADAETTRVAAASTATIATIVTSLVIRAFDHGQVDKRFIETASGGAVELHRALNLAQADDARLRRGRRRNHQSCRCQHGPHCHHLYESCDRHMFLLGWLP